MKLILGVAMWDFDGLRCAFWVGLGALALALFCLVYVAWENGASRNVGLATGTLGAAALLFIIQILFELRSNSSEPEFITVEYTIDRRTPEIRQWSYPSGRADISPERFPREIAASKALADKHPEQFSGDRGKLAQDMAIFSIVAYLLAEQYDWQMKRTHFKGRTQSVIESEYGSAPEQCTVLSGAQVRELLQRSGNLFSGDTLPDRLLCLPPQSSLTLDHESVTLKGPFCEIRFASKLSSIVNYTQPGTSGERPSLANGEARFERRMISIRASVTYSWLRAQHRDLAKYQDWAKRVVDGAALWFEADP